MPSIRLSSEQQLLDLPESSPEWYRSSDVIRILEVAKKYLPADGGVPIAVPEYTIQGGPNCYQSNPIVTSWTQGFLPGSVWLLAERERLVPGTLAAAGYSLKEVIALGRRWQESFKYQARPAENHDQGFRFQPCYGRDLQLTGSEDARNVLVEAAESLVDRFDPKVGCIRSWTHAPREGYPDEGHYREDNTDEHYLVIIDNMMNLDMMYLATELTGDSRYADIATTQAKKMLNTHVRPDFTTFHVVNFTNTGEMKQGFTAQGYANDSCWARGQAWGIYGYAQCALRTGDQVFVETSKRLADVFLAQLPESGIPWWDFNAPRPCPYDASAGTIAARGLQMLYLLLRRVEPQLAERYLDAAHKLIDDILRDCDTPEATLVDGKVDWGKDGWEPILQHSTIQGLVYADYYLLEFENEALKIKQILALERS